MAATGRATTKAPAKKALVKKAPAKKAAKPDGAEQVRTTIEEMPEPDRAIAERLDAVIRAAAPELTPRLWYGQPAYARPGRGGKVVCFFRGAAVDGERYLSLGFSGDAALDDGNVWPTAFAVIGLDASDEERIAELVRRAALPSPDADG